MNLKDLNDYSGYFYVIKNMRTISTLVEVYLREQIMAEGSIRGSLTL